VCYQRVKYQHLENFTTEHSTKNGSQPRPVRIIKIRERGERRVQKAATHGVEAELQLRGSAGRHGAGER
jgi:hypothetical protein